jgi:hypothetical protein
LLFLSKNYNGNVFRTLGSAAKLPLPSFALALFGAYHAIWRRPCQIAVAADDKTDLYFGIAARRHLADITPGAPNVRFRRQSGHHTDMGPSRILVPKSKTGCLRFALWSL